MSFGCPTICSNIEVFKEICGESALFFNPNDSEDLAHCIDEVIKNEDLKKKLKLNGLARSKIYKWEDCAKQTLEVYNKLI